MFRYQDEGVFAMMYEFQSVGVISHGVTYDAMQTLHVANGETYPAGHWNGSPFAFQCLRCPRVQSMWLNCIFARAFACPLHISGALITRMFMGMCISFEYTIE